MRWESDPFWYLSHSLPLATDKTLRLGNRGCAGAASNEGRQGWQRWKETSRLHNSVRK